MKKAFDQTFRDIKRGVNKKVLKVPGIEQKVLDATNNEPWGPHGSLLADIAHASQNYHEYQLTMGVLWKRLSDTGKNWRHVYKALTVLEYMVGHGSERAIDEIRERAYQISTLSDFQYTDSTGRDQGSNVRKKSQSLVALVNDKERIAEVREKAASNKDKYYKPPGGYGERFEYEGRYGSRDGERSSYGREYGYKDDDRNSRDGDRYSRDSEDRYGRDGNRDEEYRGRSRSVDHYQYESRGRSSDRERTFEDDGRSSSRGSGTRTDDHSQDGRGQLERKFSEQNIRDAPPSYEEAISESRSPVHSERDGGETPQVAVPGAASPPVESSVDNKAADFVNESSHQQNEEFDEFDPRSSVSAAGATTAGASAPVPSPSTVDSTAALPTTNNAEMDLLGSLSDVFSPNPLAIVSTDSTSAEIPGQASASQAPSFSASQPFDDPFGDAPFKAITSSDTDSTGHQSFGAPFQAAPSTSNPDSGHMFSFGDSYSAVSNPNIDVQNVQSPSNSSFLPQEQLKTEDDEIDILAGILPPSGQPVSLSQPDPAMPAPQFPPNGNNYDGFQPQPASPAQNIPGQTGFIEPAQPYNMVSHSQSLPGGMHFNNGGFMHQPGYTGSPSSHSPHYTPGVASHPTNASFPHQPGSATSSNSQTLPGAMQFNSGGFTHQPGYADSSSSHSPQYTGGVASHQASSSFPQQPGSITSSDSQTLPGAMHFNSGGFMHQPGYAGSPSSQPPQYTPGGASHPTSESFPCQPDSATSSNLQTPFSTPNGPAGQFNGGNFMTQQQVPGSPSHMLQRTQSEPVTTQGNYNNGVGDMFGPSSMTTSASQSALTPLTGAIEIVPPPQKKFEPKSTVWADTLSRGLVNFNISGPKTNPLADIGVDFAAINRKEKRLEKPTAATQQQVTSTINMGKAMGSGTGLGRAGASAMRPPTNSMVGSNMGMNMNVGGYGGMNQNQPMGMGLNNMNMNMGMNAGGYGGMNQNQSMGMNQNQTMGMNQNQHMGMNQNQPMGMNQNQNQPMGMNQNQPMGMNQNQPMGMNMNMGGYGQGYPMQPQAGMVMPPGPQGMAGGYNPMMGQGGYNPQQQPPYGGGYR